MKLKLLTSALLIIAFCLTITAQSKKMFSNVPTVSYCELINNAEKYDQQFIKVRATYSRGFESSIFFDESCENNKVSWIKFTSAYEQNTNKHLLKRFRKSIKGSYQKKPPEIEILIVGKFDGKRQISTLKTPVKTFTFSIGYGHMDAFDYQIMVLKLEAVNSVKEK
jgi:hypothetical protein